MSTLPSNLFSQTSDLPAEDEEEDVVDTSSLPLEVRELQRAQKSNYLIQHATGSGKSLTIACLAFLLTQLRLEDMVHFHSSSAQVSFVL